MLVGNKEDKHLEKQVSVEEGRQVADKLNIDHIVASAVNGENIEEMFESLARALWINWQTGLGRVKRLHTSRVSEVLKVAFALRVN